MRAYDDRVALVADVDNLADTVADMANRAEAEACPHVTAIGHLQEAHALIVKASNLLDGGAAALL